METREFRRIIRSFYEKAGRRFPWRNIQNPWGVLVSEFMLQQTQTERVAAYYTRWMEKWPGPRDLHNAPLEDVLREWSGLGYNRRARFLKDCARRVTLETAGVVPREPEDLRALPGIGPYSAGAIACFAYNAPTVFIETNIRSVMLHFFFGSRKEVPDREILPVLDKTLDRADPRTWYYALMDYGAALKKLAPNPGRRSAHYKKQGKFEGSFRQLRGSLLRTLLARGPATAEEIRGLMNTECSGEEDFYRVLKTMEKDLLVAEEGGFYRIREEK
ncbi:MAG: A/G-specific adenine glycosylase [Treponema sp.]|jgi:A/G-specific adenine glycosylase|nr:A/G-specific adenine glycosylase [Treponema sp.]